MEFCQLGLLQVYERVGVYSLSIREGMEFCRLGL